VRCARDDAEAFERGGDVGATFLEAVEGTFCLLAATVGKGGAM
jgi:hypothetical protein